jgi:flagellar M-ring protein FliF
VNGVAEFVKALGPSRIAAMGAVAAIMIGAFAFLLMRWNTPQLTPLFAELTLTDSAAVARELDRMQIRYEVRNDGTLIAVPRQDVPRIRMKLAETGLPRGGGSGYELFDRSETLGTTSFVQNLNHLRAMEGELSRSIRSIDRVQGARVHLVIPERQIFTRERQEPTASIVLRMRGDLDTAQVRAIQHLVASAVPGMKPGNVSIVDEAGRLLASGRGEERELAAGAMEERRLSQEARLRREVEDILGKVVGSGRSRVQVAAELDWTRSTQSQDIFDPEQRVVRSTQTRTERSTSQEARDRQVTVGNELPQNQRNQQPNQNGDQAQNREQAEKSEEIVNFEISRTQRQEVTEPGRLRRVSVAVLVDGVYTRQGDQLVYAPRPQEELDRIAALVRTAIGFDERRGDKVEIVNLRFAEGPPVPALATEDPIASLFSFTRDDIMRFAEMGVTLILALITLFFVIRPLLKRMLGEQNPQPAIAADAEERAALTDGGSAGELTAEGDGTPALDKPMVQLGESATSRALEVAAMTSQLHVDSVTKIGELVQTNPNEAVAIVRSWMNEAQHA